MTDGWILIYNWRTLQPMLCELLPNDFVDFREFLDRYDVKHGSGGITKDANSAILNQLYPHRERLKVFFVLSMLMAMVLSHSMSFQQVADC